MIRRSSISILVAASFCLSTVGCDAAEPGPKKSNIVRADPGDSVFHTKNTSGALRVIFVLDHFVLTMSRSIMPFMAIWCLTVLLRCARHTRGKKQHPQQLLIAGGFLACLGLLLVSLDAIYELHPSFMLLAALSLWFSAVVVVLYISDWTLKDRLRK